MLVQKAGCILVDKKNKKIGLIYREELNDYSFPKGHLEEGETIKECAIRETAEETKRDCEIVDGYVISERYISSVKEDTLCHFYIAFDKGESKNASEDTHELIWTDLDKVHDKLSYNSLKKIWKEVRPKVEELLK